MESSAGDDDIVPSTHALIGFIILILSLVCLGTWPALLRLCSTLPPSTTNSTRILRFFPAIQRDTRFAYMDYALAYVISSSIPLAISLSSHKENDAASYQDNDEHNDNNNNILILFPLIGGTLLSLGNMSMQWATTVYGSSLTTVVAIQASMTVILGTSINYFLEPQRTARPLFLLIGVFVFLIAIGFASRAHLLYGKQEQQQRCTSRIGQTVVVGEQLGLNDRTLDNANIDTNINNNEERSTTRHALIITFIGGCCFGFFSPAFNIAINDPFNWTSGNNNDNNNDNNNSYNPQNMESSALSVPVANLWFSFAFTLASFVGSIPLMHHPPYKSSLLPTTLSNYCQDEPMSHRLLALLAGCVCGWGNLLQFQGGKMVGFAAADLVQAFPIVSTFWDMYVFGEFQQQQQQTHKEGRNLVLFYLVAMYIMYGSGIFFLISSVAQ